MFMVRIIRWGNVRIHFRHHNPDKADFQQDKTPGTQCLVCLAHIGDFQVAEGQTELAEGDTYCKEFGRKLSLTRAIAELSRDERTKVWNTYFENRGISFEKEG